MVLPVHHWRDTWWFTCHPWQKKRRKKKKEKNEEKKKKKEEKNRRKNKQNWICLGWEIKHIVVGGEFPEFSRNTHQGFTLLAGSHEACELKGGQFLDLQVSMQRQSVLSDTLSKQCGQTSVVRAFRECPIPQASQPFYFLKYQPPNTLQRDKTKILKKKCLKPT